jgi:hypothetical protein
MAYLIIAAVVAAILLVVLIAHVVAAHLLIALVGAGAFLVVLIFVVLSFVRGLSHHTVISTYQIEPPKKRPELPPPAKPQVLTGVPVQVRDPFSVGEPGTWHDLIEAADRDELLRQGPREGRQPARACEGPDCNELLDDNPWTIEADRGQGKEEHAFCSRECLDGWHRADSAEHAGRSGIA